MKLFERDPVAAKSWLDENSNNEEYDTILGIMIAKAPIDKALSWMEDMQSKDSRNYRNAAGEMARQWYFDDPDPAYKWAREQKDPMVRDYVLYRIVWGNNRDYPSQTFYIGLEIKGLRYFKYAMKGAIREWKEKDPVAVEAAIAEANVKNSRKIILYQYLEKE